MKLVSWRQDTRPEQSRKHLDVIDLLAGTQVSKLSGYAAAGQVKADHAAVEALSLGQGQIPEDTVVVTELRQADEQVVAKSSKAAGQPRELANDLLSPIVDIDHQKLTGR